MYGTTSSVAIKVLYDDMKIAVKCETLNVKDVITMSRNLV